MTVNLFSSLYLGCAGWSLPREQWPRFQPDGSHLERYASRFNAVEINSSFYRPHRASTYARWAAAVPPGFRFSVKVPRQITHDARLNACEPALAEFLDQCMALGDRLGCLLVQLPPSLAYDPPTACAFFAALRQRYSGPVVLEPRHPSWLQARELLQAQRIGWVEADPAPLGEAAPQGWEGVAYVRLHGSPKIYYSAYAEPVLQALAARLAAAAVPTWCIFDNTAAGAAVPDALWVLEHLGS
ncbi:DUF72 domain-containing protein [Pseudomonas sp. RIT-PI-S]|uniref:DUF72 domain-containing protein n=1 Tax=Pseudomonas sp. RIT-PI-S TaxID=3035295 RepID=UPI0021D9AA49|nr:DUF72 domain-containing protein [Pseudomonas sp. RIT-PI-S]